MNPAPLRFINLTANVDESMATTHSPHHPNTAEDDRILVALALALVDQPRASLQELARAIGVSKATLYRYCSTRQALIDRLAMHSGEALNQAIQAAELDSAPPLDALRALIARHLEHRELTIFLMYYWKDASTDVCSDCHWNKALDAFFLRGQEAGVFRIDISAPALTEIFGNLLIGLFDAERRGRVARMGLAELIESAFLHGTRTQG